MLCHIHPGTLPLAVPVMGQQPIARSPKATISGACADHLDTGGSTCAPASPACDTACMKDDRPLPNYAGHRFPPEVIGYAVWAYYRFPLSYRDVEELLAERGVIVSDETIRRWCLKFGQGYANALRRRCPRPDASCRRARCAGRGGSPSRWHLLPRPAAEPRSTALPASASPPTSPKNSPRAG